jgi:hypothetical protein
MLREFWSLRLTRLYVTLYKDNKRKRDWWIVDVDPKSLKHSNIFWACEFPYLS